MIIKKGCNYESEYKDGVLHISLKGEIDHHSAVSVRSGIDERIYELRPRKLVMDLSRIEFMDSSGLGLIMGRYNRITELGGILKIGNPGRSAVRMMKMSGADKLIPIVFTEEKGN